jgi:hypothetical protein
MKPVRRSLGWLAAGAVLGASLTLLIAAQAGVAGLGQLANYFFGPKLVRAEVVLKENDEIVDYRLDRGRIKSFRGGVLVLWEPDRTLATIPVSPSARVEVDRIPSLLTALRPGMNATTIRRGESPAETIFATTPRPGRK